MTPPSCAELIEQVRRGELDYFTKCIFGIIAGLMFFKIPEEEGLRLYLKFKDVLDQHPEHSKTIYDMLAVAFEIVDIKMRQAVPTQTPQDNAD